MPENAFTEAAEALKAGRPAVFPTDTVYGIGVAVDAAADCSELFAIKERPAGKAVAWLVGSVDDLARFGADVQPWVFELAREHWPGALTLVVKASEAVPRAFRADDGTIGLRMPASHTALKLIAECGCPLATTSANLSGQKAPGSYDELDAKIVSRAAAAIEGSVPAIGLASTVVDCTGEAPRVLRQGSVQIAPTRLR